MHRVQKYPLHKNPKNALLLIFFYNFFSLYNNVKWILSKKEERTKKKARERYQDHSEKKKVKSVNIVAKDKKIFPKMKSKG